MVKYLQLFIVKITNQKPSIFLNCSIYCITSKVE